MLAFDTLGCILMSNHSSAWRSSSFISAIITTQAQCSAELGGLSKAVRTSVVVEQLEYRHSGADDRNDEIDGLLTDSVVAALASPDS